MLEWLIGTLSAWFGISPLASIFVLVGVSVGGSAALRWYRRMRQAENYYLELASHDVPQVDVALQSAVEDGPPVSRNVSMGRRRRRAPRSPRG